MPEPSFVKRFLRERALSRYLAALERGDIDAVIAVLDQSARDNALEQMIFDLHETYQTEEEFLEMVQQVQDEPDVMEVENGVFKSRLEGKLPDLKRAKKRGYRVYERIGQSLVAAVLVFCVVSSVILTAEFTRGFQTPSGSPASANRCVMAGVPISSYQGVPTFNQVAALAPDDVWVAGNLYNAASSQRRLPLLEHWDGARWSVVPGGNVQSLYPGGGNWNEAYLTHLAVISPDNIWAVGGIESHTVDAYNNNIATRGQPLIEHWNGWQWQTVPVASPPGESYSVFNDLVALAGDNIWAVGYASDASQMHTSALLEHWDGSRWTRISQDAPLARVGVLDRVIATAPDDIWIFGRMSPLFQNFAVAEHWNGHDWQLTSLSDVAGMTAASSAVGLSSTDIWVIGTAPQLNSGPAPALLIHWNGQSWQKIAGAKELGTGATLRDLTVDSEHNVWAVGSGVNERALIEHWNGQAWSIIQHEAPPYSYLVSVSLTHGKIWAVGGTYKSGLDTTPTGSLIEVSC
jgi:hypothetical protein